MCTTIDTVISLIVVYIIGFLCVALIGYHIGEITAYKRYLKTCNERRNNCKNATVRKNRTVGG